LKRGASIDANELSRFIFGFGDIEMEAEKMSVVLLVEDDPGDQKLMRYALSQQELRSRLEIVGTAEEALTYLERSITEDSDACRPDLILLDLNMPGIGGKEFLRRIKHDGRFSDIPVVIVSTSDSTTDIQDSYRMKAAGYIQKCPSPEELRRVVQKLVHYWFATSTLVKKEAKAAECA
jgi:chemotaxis family two-component system response regulator Rcp1